MFLNLINLLSLFPFNFNLFFRKKKFSHTCRYKPKNSIPVSTSCLHAVRKIIKDDMS